MKTTWISGLLVFAGVVFLSGFHSSWIPSFFSLLVLCALCLTALPLTRMLFPDPVDSWILAFPVGYVLHAFFLSLAGLIFGVNRMTAIIYIAAVLLIPALQRRLYPGGLNATAEPGAKGIQSPQSFQGGSDWKNGDMVSLLIWLFVTLAIVAVPFARIGENTVDGYAYRAYFNADFFRNMAVTGALSHSGIPPDNPYLGGNTLRYYWFFHLIPAYWNQLFTSYRPDFLMVQFSVVALLMFVSSLFVVLRRFAHHRKTLLFLLPVLAFGGSYEGLYILHWLKNRQLPWTEFANLNIDGILRWNWKAPQIDTLYRAFLYAPQHLIALAILLVALLIWNSERLGQEPLKGKSRPVLFYFLIFSTLGFSAFIGATLILGAALILLIQTFRRPKTKWKELVFSGLLGLLFLAVYLYPFEMFQPGSQQMDFGPDKIIMAHLPEYFLLNWGALLLLGIAGVFYRSPSFPNRILLFFLIFCFALIVFLRLMLAGFSDISLKVGHFSHVILLLIAAGAIDRFLAKHSQKTGRLAVMMAILVLPAMVTWGMDAWNSSDIRNRRFTTVMSRDDAEVCRWMRKNLPEKTIVLNYSPQYEEFTRDIIPAFGERSLFLGNRIFSRIFQVPEKQVRDRANVVDAILRLSTPRETWTLARESGIEYIFVSEVPADRMPGLVQKLAPPQFSLVIQEGKTAVFRVNKE